MLAKEVKKILEKHGWSPRSFNSGNLYYRHKDFSTPIIIPKSDEREVSPLVLSKMKEMGVLPSAYNSVEFYEEEIKRLNEEKKNLEKQLALCHGDTSSHNTKDVLLEKQLNDAKKRILELEQEKTLKKQNVDAEKEWSNKITEAFKDLETKLDPIKKERVRLNYMYYASVLLIAVALGLLVVIEYNIFNHFISVEVKSLLDYLPYCSPIPFIGIILWIAIYQMNKSQRQLFVLAEQIHNIKYVEGLLLALNKLAPDISNSVYRLNKSIDKIIDNQLMVRGQIQCDEEDLESIGKKDNDVIPINAFNEIIKTCLQGKSS